MMNVDSRYFGSDVDFYDPHFIQFSSLLCIEDYEDEELDPVKHENLLEMEEDINEDEAEEPDLPDLDNAPSDTPFNFNDLGNFPHLAEYLELVRANDAGLFFERLLHIFEKKNEKRPPSDVSS